MKIKNNIDETKINCLETPQYCTCCGAYLTNKIDNKNKIKYATCEKCKVVWRCRLIP